MTTSNNGQITWWIDCKGNYEKEREELLQILREMRIEIKKLLK